MKNIMNIKAIFFTLIAIVMVACNQEPAIQSDASFTIENSDSIFAGSAIQMVFEGQGEFVTVYSGDSKRIYGDPESKGIRLTKETYGFTYSSQGEYEFTVVASSYGNWGEEEIVDVKSQTLFVQDRRNDIVQFKFKGLNQLGEFQGNDIIFNFSDAIDITALKADWILASEDAEVFYGDAPVVDEVTEMDYSNPVVLTVVAPNGDSKDYTVTINIYPANDETEILRLGCVNPDREAVIDPENREIYLKVPPGTNLGAVQLYAVASEGATMKNGPKSIIATPFSHSVRSQPTEIVVTAENGTKESWYLYTNFELTFREFSFSDLVPEVVGVIDSTELTIDLKVIEGTRIDSLVSYFTLSGPGEVLVNNVTQVSGVTANDFTDPLLYKIVDNDDDEFEFRVRVTVVSK